MAINCGNKELCMKKPFSAAGCGRMWEGEKAEMERLNEDGSQDESKSGKGEVEGETEKWRTRRICKEHLPSQVFGEHGSVSEVVLGLHLGLLGVCLMCFCLCLL